MLLKSLTQATMKKQQFLTSNDYELTYSDISGGRDLYMQSFRKFSDAVHTGKGSKRTNGVIDFSVTGGGGGGDGDNPVCIPIRNTAILWGNNKRNIQMDYVRMKIFYLAYS